MFSWGQKRVAAKESIIHWALAPSITSWRVNSRLLGKVDRWHGGLPPKFQKTVFCKSQDFSWGTAMGRWALRRINTVFPCSHFNLRKLDGATLSQSTWQIAVGLQLQPHTFLGTRNVILQNAAKLIGIERKEYWNLVYVSDNKIIEVAVKEKCCVCRTVFQKPTDLLTMLTYVLVCSVHDLHKPRGVNCSVNHV